MTPLRSELEEILDKWAGDNASDPTYDRNKAISSLESLIEKRENGAIMNELNRIEKLVFGGQKVARPVLLSDYIDERRAELRGDTTK